MMGQGVVEQRIERQHRETHPRALDERSGDRRNNRQRSLEAALSLQAGEIEARIGAKGRECCLKQRGRARSGKGAEIVENPVRRPEDGAPGFTEDQADGLTRPGR